MNPPTMISVVPNNPMSMALAKSACGCAQVVASRQFRAALAAPL
jgi:hypothetical protein